MRPLILLAALVSACAAPALETGGATADAPAEALSFAESVQPPAPDYALAASWAARPGAANPSDSVPPGASSVSGDAAVDVFYVHPTTYRTSSAWNQDIALEDVNAWTDASTIARQASVFNDCCWIFAPRYRQASFLAVQDRTLAADGGKAYELAYQDILAAFDHYMAHDNQGRPFIIAGHSQGALMSYWLLRDRIDGAPAAERLVAAYVVGLDLMEGDFGRTFKSLKPCETPAQTGCILGWNAVTPELDLEMMGAMAGGRYKRVYGVDDGRTPVCLNPVTFDAAKPSSDAAQSKGAVPGEPGAGPLRALIAGQVAARCDLGFLVVTADESLDLTPLPGGSMHYHDFGLFYEDIRANVRVRIAAWQSK